MQSEFGLEHLRLKIGDVHPVRVWLGRYAVEGGCCRASSFNETPVCALRARLPDV